MNERQWSNDSTSEAEGTSNTIADTLLQLVTVQERQHSLRHRRHQLDQLHFRGRLNAGDYAAERSDNEIELEMMTKINKELLEKINGKDVSRMRQVWRKMSRITHFLIGK